MASVFISEIPACWRKGHHLCFVTASVFQCVLKNKQVLILWIFWEQRERRSHDKKMINR